MRIVMSSMLRAGFQSGVHVPRTNLSSGTRLASPVPVSPTAKGIPADMSLIDLPCPGV